MLMKNYKSFSLLSVNEENSDVGYVLKNEDDLCVIIPMPKICRSKSRKAKDSGEGLVQILEPLELEKRKAS